MDQCHFKMYGIMTVRKALAAYSGAEVLRTHPG